MKKEKTNKIKIIIKGQAGSGKTTLLVKIRKLLEAEGIKVKVEDLDVAGLSDDRLQEMISEHLTTTLPTEVLIKTKQTKR